MVTVYHTELVQVLIALELDDLSILNYSCTFDDSYSLLKSTVTDQFTNYLFIFGSLQRAFINLFHVGLSSQRIGSLSYLQLILEALVLISAYSSIHIDKYKKPMGFSKLAG